LSDIKEIFDLGIGAARFLQRHTTSFYFSMNEELEEEKYNGSFGAQLAG